MNRTTRRTGLLAATAMLVSLVVAAPASTAPVWLSQQPLSDGVADSSSEQVEMNAKGDAVALWLQSGPGGARFVRAAFRPAGGPWGPAFDVSEPNGTVFAPDVAVDEAGGVAVVWRDVIDANGPVTVLATRMRSAAGVWGDAEQVSPAGQEFDPTVTMDAGATTIAWEEPVPMTSTSRIRSRHRTAAGIWEAVETHSSIGSVFDPQLAAAAGVLALVWRDRTSGTDRTRATVRASDGNWSSALDLSAAGGFAANAAVSVDQAGAVTVAWNRDSGDHDVVQVVSRTPTGVWGTVHDASKPGVDSSFPDLALDAGGGVHLAWRESGANYTVAAAIRPAGGVWGPPQTVSSPALEAGIPSVAADAAGSTVVVWRAEDPAAQTDVILSARRPAGGSFQAVVPVSPPAPHGSSSADVGTDAAGNAVSVFRTVIGGHVVVQAADLDTVPPVLSGFVVPSTGMAGKALAYSASASDARSGVASYAWTFGDGTSAVGAAVSHVYATQGSYPVTLTVTDAAGNVATRTATTTVAAPVPLFALFKLKKKRIATDEKTKLKVNLNTASTLKLVFKSKHKHVVKGKKKYVKVVLRKQFPAGLSKITIKAKVKGTKLKPDTYVLKSTATNSSGTSPKKKTKLKVVR